MSLHGSKARRDGMFSVLTGRGNNSGWRALFPAFDSFGENNRLFVFPQITSI